MHFNMNTIEIALVFACSIYLMLQYTDKLFPVLAVVASGIELLLVMGLMSLSLAKFRIDVILPAILVLAGVMCWMKVSTKGTITAATIVALVGAIQLLGALHILS
jgi:hypothetical protein